MCDVKHPKSACGDIPFFYFPIHVRLIFDISWFLYKPMLPLASPEKVCHWNVIMNLCPWLSMVRYVYLKTGLKGMGVYKILYC